MNFKDYKDGASTRKAEKTPETKLNKGAERLLKNFVKDYEGKSREELYAEILKVAKENRANGKLSDADVENFYTMLAPMLDKEQLKLLDNVVAEIKKDC